MMQKLFLFIAFFYCLNAIAQEEDPIEYDPNLIGGWEVCSYIKMAYDGTGTDTIDVSPDSAYLNLTLIIQRDYSLQKLMMPANKSEHIQGYSKKRKLNLDRDGDRLWLDNLYIRR